MLGRHLDKINILCADSDIESPFGFKGTPVSLCADYDIESNFGFKGTPCVLSVICVREVHLCCVFAVNTKVIIIDCQRHALNVLNDLYLGINNSMVNVKLINFSNNIH